MFSEKSNKLKKDIFQIKKEAVFATVSLTGIPNIVPIHSKHLVSNRKILISDQFMNKTRTNIIENPNGVLAIMSDDTLYTISGTCTYKASGFMYKMAVRGAKKYAKKHAENKEIKIQCKGIVLMKVQNIQQERIGEKKL